MRVNNSQFSSEFQITAYICQIIKGVMRFTLFYYDMLITKAFLLILVSKNDQILETSKDKQFKTFSLA